MWFLLICQDKLLSFRPPPYDAPHSMTYSFRSIARYKFTNNDCCSVVECWIDACGRFIACVAWHWVVSVFLVVFFRWRWGSCITVGTLKKHQCTSCRMCLCVWRFEWRWLTACAYAFGPPATQARYIGHAAFNFRKTKSEREREREG